MNVICIVGSYRKGKTIDSLTDRAIEGVLAGAPEASVQKVHLISDKMEYCRNCMACRNDDPGKETADCVIEDDITALLPDLQNADGLLFATPINCGTVTAVMKTFLERTAWTLARPGNEPLPGCPEPRSAKRKRAAIILSTGIVPPELREHCDDATSLITSNAGCCYNAEVVGSLYAGAVEHVGREAYLDQAFELGRTLAAPGTA